MNPEQMLDAIATRMAAARIDVRAHDLDVRTAGRGGGWIRVTMPPTALQRECGYVEVTNDAAGVVAACQRISRWHRAHLGWHEALLDAHGFLHGDAGRPYMVDAVIDRHIGACGVTWSSFADSLAACYRRPAVISTGYGGLPDCYADAFRTYHEVPEDFQMAGYYRRSHDLLDMHRIGATQGVVAQLGGRNLTMDVVIVPGVLWKSSGAPMVYITGQTFPSAILQGVRGRRLVDVVGADAFDVEGLDVVAMRHDGRRTVIQVRDVRVDVSSRRTSAKLRKAA